MFRYHKVKLEKKKYLLQINESAIWLVTNKCMEKKNPSVRHQLPLKALCELIIATLQKATVVDIPKLYSTLFCLVLILA